MSAFSPIEDIIAEARAGRMYVLVDAEDRENEGDLIIPACFADADAINFMARFGRGLICLALDHVTVGSLGLPMMTGSMNRKDSTAFTVSIDAASGITTGISAADRAATIRAAIAPGARMSDLTMPGHIFPLRARPGGVLARPGHTEAGVDISRAAGLDASAVICEIMGEDGHMIRLPELIDYASRHGMKTGSISDLIALRKSHGDSQEVIQKSDKESPAVLIVISRYYADIAAELESGARTVLEAAGVDTEAIEVAGAFEIPSAIARAAREGRYGGFVALGCVIRGQTSHYDLIAGECARGLMDLGLSGIPVGFGVLTCDTLQQARRRADIADGDKGGEAARACLSVLNA